MKLIKLVRLDDRYAVESAAKPESLASFIKYTREQQNRRGTEVELAAGLTHPRLFRLEDGTTHSVETFLIAVEELGYEVFLKKREQ